MNNQSENESPNYFERESNRLLNTVHKVQRAFKEFLTLPTCIIVCFLLLIVLSHALDSGLITWLQPFRSFMKGHIFSNPKATSSLLSAIASGIITVSSLTITLLLLVVQQSASSMTTQVFDQFLRSTQNQIYFGFFIGLALYTLLVLSMVSDTFNPIIGASFVLMFTVVALYLLVVLIYTTIYEMRPAVIIEAIYEHVLKSRNKQLKLISKTRRSAQYEGAVQVPVFTRQHGYITTIDIDKIQAAAKKNDSEVEIELQVSIGDFVAYQDQVALIKAAGSQKLEELANIVYQSIKIEKQRNLDMDPNDGINQLEMIAWTSISTAKSNPQPGLLSIRILRNIVSKWADEDDSDAQQVFAIVYKDDVPGRLLDTFETLGVAASESMQHQTFTEVLHTLCVVFDRLPPPQQKRVEDIILRLLSVMGDFALTAPLEAALKTLIAKLASASRSHTMQAVETAYHQLAASIGKLNSRSSRVNNSKP